MKQRKMSAALLKEMLDEKTIELENLHKSRKKLEERMTAQLIIEDEEDEQTKETEETEEVEEPDDSEQEEPGYDESAGEATDETDDEQES